VTHAQSYSQPRKKEIEVRNLKAPSMAVVLLLPGLLPECAIEGKCGADGCAGDEQVTASVRTTFDQHPDLGPPAAIRVQTLNRVVCLNGLVNSGVEREAAASLASQVAGAARVENNIAAQR
jgi:osmotically-inducible protein OsmY